MSAHTVEAHLSTIYRVLGIHSRAELNAMLTKDHAPARDSTGRSRDSAPS
jgi:DNA-binding NarL/FixJ family response regulator